MPEQFRAVSYIDGLFALSRNYLINYVNMETVRYSYTTNNRLSRQMRRILAPDYRPFREHTA